MKKIVMFLFGILIGSASLFAGTSKYVANDAEVDALISDAVEISIHDIGAANAEMVSMMSLLPNNFQGEKTAVAAFIICWFVGALGIHRLYLGTSTGTFIGYLLTLGGCGVVAFIDWIMLLIALVDGGDISKYIDNPKFFMW